MKTVVIIDDNEDDLFFTRLVLERSGRDCTLISFQSAPQALVSVAKGELPADALVLLDINMPVMNGFDFLQAYEALPTAKRAQLSVVMLTSSYNKVDKDRAFGFASVKSFVNKPLTAEQAGQLLDQMETDSAQVQAH